jgi:hypothetical protein
MLPYLFSNQEGGGEAGSWFHGFLFESNGGGLPTRRCGAKSFRLAGTLAPPK